MDSSSFVSISVRGDKEFARKVRKAARSRGMRLGDYVRTLIVQDCGHEIGIDPKGDGSPSFFDQSERQTDQSSKSPDTARVVVATTG
jgi:hypothetical protein